MSNDDWDKRNTGTINVDGKMSNTKVYFMKDVNPDSALNARDWSESNYSRMDSNSRYWTRDGEEEEEEEDFGGGRRIRQSKKRQGGSRLRRGATKRSGGSRKKRRGSRKKRGTK